MYKPYLSPAPIEPHPNIRKALDVHDTVNRIDQALATPADHASLAFLARLCQQTWASCQTQQDQLNFKEIFRQYENYSSIFLQKMLAHRDTFKHVFEVEQGSLYWLANDDSSWRFKQTREGLVMSEVCDLCCFIDTNKFSEVKRDLAMKLYGKSQTHFSFGIPAVPFAIGRSVVEIEWSDLNLGTSPGIKDLVACSLIQEEQTLSIDLSANENFLVGFHSGGAVSSIIR